MAINLSRGGSPIGGVSPVDLTDEVTDQQLHSQLGLLAVARPHIEGAY